MKEIGDKAFYEWYNLKSITIPSSVIKIESGAFYGCGGLENINVEIGNTVYDSRDNCNALIEMSTNTLIKGSKNTIIPNSVTSIGICAFYSCSSLVTVNYTGTEEQWNEIIISSNNGPLIHATINYNYTGE